MSAPLNTFSRKLSSNESIDPTVTTFDHLAPRAQQAAAQDASTRIQIIRGDWVIRHAAVIQGLNAARWLLEGPRRTRTTGLLVTGEVGAGKTTLAKLIKRLYPVPEKSNDEPVVMITLTGARHMRTIQEHPAASKMFRLRSDQSASSKCRRGPGAGAAPGGGLRGAAP